MCWRIGATVLVSIVLVEAAILIPSYLNYERDLLKRVEREGFATVQSLFLMKHQARPGELGMMAERLTKGSALMGGAIYREDGSLMVRFGEAPTLKPAPAAKATPLARRSGDGTRYDVRWLPDDLGASYTVVGRLDSSWLAAELTAFVWRIIGLVLLISSLVTGTTMLIFGATVMVPVLRLREAVAATAADPEHLDAHIMKSTRRDELGDVIAAFGKMQRDVARIHRREIERVVALTENSIAAMVAYDGEGRLVYCNAACLALCGVESAKALGAADYPRVAADPDAEALPLHRHLAKGAVSKELIIEVAEGRFVPCLVSGGRLGGRKRAERLYYASILDVTEMHEYRQRLEETNLDLYASSRAKSDFLAHMSHELRTPLNAVIGFSELMQREIFGPLGSPRYGEYVTDIHDSGVHLLEIINDILDLSKIEAGKVDLAEQNVDIAKAVQASVRLMRERADAAGLQMISEVSSSLPLVRADERMIRQILLNLLSNAIKFTPKGGTVTVDAGLMAGGEFEIAVKDTGIGIAAEDIPRVMEPFAQVENTLDRRFDGTGLGLPLVRSFVKLHDGAVDIESTPGKGTTVRVRLPKKRVVAAREAKLALAAGGKISENRVMDTPPAMGSPAPRARTRGGPGAATGR